RAGKDGLKVRYLLNMIREDDTRSRSHGLAVGILQLQAKALGIPLVQRRAAWENYEAEFKGALHDFKEAGVDSGVFGDIDFNAHREWVDRVCGEAGLAPHLPLWGLSQDNIMKEFVELGFEAIVVATKADLLGKEWLGRKIDRDFLVELDELGKTKGITPCGEAGEYHTLVTNGPLFHQRVEILEADIISKDEHWFLDISKGELRNK
ncbi:diphthine--ammonia ligase, partial [Chloroflexota bacterium]